jgi:hypothetical protein
MDGVMRDAERLGVRNWRNKAKDRDGWRRLFESAKTLHGLERLGVSEWKQIIVSNISSGFFKLRHFKYL